jgi:hypothetical protein
MSSNGAGAVPYTIVCDQEGRITVFAKAGAYHTAGCALVRYNQDGSLDTTFGVGGKIVVTSDEINMMINEFMANPWPLLDMLESKGSHQSALIAIRYLPDGKRDATFGNNGVITTDVMVPADEPVTLIIDEHEKRIMKYQMVQEQSVVVQDDVNYDVGASDPVITVVVSEYPIECNEQPSDALSGSVIVLDQLEQRNKPRHADKTWWEVSDLTRALRRKIT